MAATASQRPKSTPTDDSPEPKRRKVRKGTQSCWECKRRKVRCIFTAPTDSICHGCRRRGSSCIGQEFPDEPATSVGEGVRDRLDRMEALVGKLVKHSGPPELLPRESRRASNTHGPKSNAGIPTPAPSDVDGTARPSCLGHQRVHEIAAERPSNPLPLLPSPTTMWNARVTAKYDELSSALLMAWPNQHALDVILNLPIGVSGLYHGVICTPYSSFFDQDAPSPHDIVQPPPRGSHPVLIARRLLILGKFLQGVSPDSIPEPASPADVRYRDIMTKAVETATSLVTSNDRLVDSIEGIECIMIESMYHNNAGNLRRAWLAIRRAMVMAQMMGLHRGGSGAPLLKVLERDTRARVDPAHMWLRLVQSDRYLSLLLGLPQGSLDDSFADSKVLEACTPTERLERLDCVAAGRILQRNDADLHNIAATREIDELLQKAAAAMPPQWWLIPEAIASGGAGGDNMAALREMIRIMDQFAHYNLLVQLHLPYILRSSTDRAYDYFSNITAVNASRELLARFVAFRTGNPASSYCRGVDFLAFIASTALCLAHIDARRQCRLKTQHGDEGEDGKAALNFFVHQRLSDRGLMERTLGSMDIMAHASSDAIATKTSSILRHLLAIEDDAANGASYHTSSSTPFFGGGDSELECAGKLTDSGKALRIRIPYFGTIVIKSGSGSVSKPILAMSPLALAQSVCHEEPVVSFGYSPVRESQHQHEQHEQHEQHQQVVASPRAGYRVGCGSVNPDWQVVPAHLDPPLELAGHSTPVAESTCGFKLNADGVHGAQLLVPGLAAEADDWALQGVDMAFFDNLIRGVSGPDGAEVEPRVW